MDFAIFGGGEGNETPRPRGLLDHSNILTHSVNGAKDGDDEDLESWLISSSKLQENYISFKYEMMGVQCKITMQ